MRDRLRFVWGRGVRALRALLAVRGFHALRALRAWRGPRGHCRLGVSREAVSVLRVGASRRSAPVVAERALSDLGVAPPDALAAQIAAALDAAGGSRLPVYATLGDDVVRYFIVTPPGNGARMQDLRAAAAVRFQVLYGEPAASWQIVADWQAATPFLACAVPQRLHTALQLAVAARRGCLVSVMPDFVAAWNRSRRHLKADTWLATLSDGVLTLGLIAGAPDAADVASAAKAATPHLAAVRTLVLPDETPPIAWLREQVARAALLDNLTAPSVLYVHGPRIDGWSAGSATTASVSSGDAGMSVRWCAPGDIPFVADGNRVSATSQLAWGGATP